MKNLNKADVALCFINYAAAIGFLAAHDWKLVAALAFWGTAKLCWADAQRPSEKPVENLKPCDPMKNP